MSPGAVERGGPPARPLIATSIPAAWNGWSLADAVACLARIDEAAAVELIQRGGAWLERRRCQAPETSLVAGQPLMVHFAPPEEPRAAVSAADILYEDSALLVLNKPPGAYVTMTPWDATNNLLEAMRRFLEARDDRRPTLHLAHQLDRDTSGVLMFTVDPRANAAIQDAFVRRAMDKRYHALVGGRPQWQAIDMHTGHGRGAHGLFQIYPLADVGTHPEGRRHIVKEMRTRLEVVETFADAALIEARPLTGRTHQIRLHLREAGHPVAGDARYGGASGLAGLDLPHHLLHAAALELPHPIHRRPLRLEAPLPPLFTEALRRLRNVG